MIEKETLAPEERQLVSAVIYNRLHARMPLGIDATLRYGLHIPPTESITQSQLDSDNPYNTRNASPGLPPTPIANPGPRFAAGRRAPGEGRLPLLRAQAGQEAPLLHGQRGRVRAATRPRTATVIDATLRSWSRCSAKPVAESLSPRMQNAAFAARRALDWAVRRRSRSSRSGWRRRSAGCVAARLRRRERDDPAQAGGRRALRRGRGRGGEHARLPRRPRARVQHRQGDRRRDRGRARLPDRRGRRGAGAAARRCRARCACSPAAANGRRTPRLRPDRERDAGRATSCSSSRGREQAVVDLAYRADGSPTALVAAAREAGARLVVDGLEALVRQGAASFALWTGASAACRGDAQPP